MNEIAGLYQKKIRKRTIILTFFIFLWFIGLTLRLIQLQVIEHERLREAVNEQNQSERDIYPERGTITDRHGKIMARSLPVPTVFFVPNGQEPAARQFARVEQLKKILDLSGRELLRIRTQIEKDSSFVYIKRQIRPEQAEQVRRLDLSGIYFQEENKRFYPLGRLAAHVLGGTDIDGKGLAGVELRHDSRLEGVKGMGLFLRDGNRTYYHWEILKQPVPGKDLILTLDETIQYIAEKELEKAVRAQDAEWGTAIVSSPASGEILAMASYPTYDPNEFPPSPYIIARNRAIHENFEPGSTFKIVTSSAAIESGAVNFSDIFDCSDGRIRVAGWTISDHKRMGVLTFPEVIIHSSNVGTIMVSQRLGEKNLHNMIKAYHFGEKTGIDLPGEENGIFHPLKEWSGSSLASHAIGYGISVTALQILQAMNVVANRGILVPPRISREMFDFSTAPPDISPSGERIISTKTAEELIEQIFEKVVLDGTGQEAQLNGFTVAGKTGTAQIREPGVGYSAGKHLASFVGFVPAEKPVLSMIVVINEPKAGLHYGGQVAAPVFREIAQRVLLYLRQFPQFDPSKKIITARAQIRSLD
jgi:cell division protein FtsI/penicillin-binding protein 2